MGRGFQLISNTRTLLHKRQYVSTRKKLHFGFAFETAEVVGDTLSTFILQSLVSGFCF